MCNIYKTRVAGGRVGALAARYRIQHVGIAALPAAIVETMRPCTRAYRDTASSWCSLDNGSLLRDGLGPTTEAYSSHPAGF